MEVREGRITLENRWCRLVIDADCQAKSLMIKASGEECLRGDEEIAFFSATQDRPFNNEVKLAHPNKRTVFQANRVRKDGERLIVGFEIIPCEAVIGVREADDYFAFTLLDLIYHDGQYGTLKMDLPPVTGIRLIQLPVIERLSFGEWLNVSWDERSAVNVLATSPYATIDSERRKGYRVMTADARKGIKLKGCGAALIACETGRLLDAIDRLEKDFDLPRGVESRRSGKVNASSLHVSDLTPGNVDEYIRYAKRGGFRRMLLYYTCFFEERHCYGLLGNYDFRPEYPEGMDDLKKVVGRIRAAGITPGIHILQTHIGLESRYATPVADHRLNLKARFTLSRPLDVEETTLYVEENPEEVPLHPKCRILRFGGELIRYGGISTDYPYCFTGCERGDHATRISNHPMGEIGGILDVSEFGAVSAYIDQHSDLQDEIARKLAAVYNIGFEFIYFDGSEGTNVPYEFHVPNAQYRVYKQLERKPVFTAGAAKAHFSWHFLSGGNAFDIFYPSVFKEKICEFPMEEAPRMRQDFTGLNFGWWGYWRLGESVDSEPGTQPDMLEFGTSRAAAWDCPTTLMSFGLAAFDGHPRTADNLEVMRRWEDVRAKGWLTDGQKEELRSSGEEHILLIDEKGEYELVRYRQIEQAVQGDSRVRAFLLERQGSRCVVYWHTAGEGRLLLPLSPREIILKGELAGARIPVEETSPGSRLPIGDRLYLTSHLSTEAMRSAFEAAVLE